MPSGSILSIPAAGRAHATTDDASDARLPNLLGFGRRLVRRPLAGRTGSVGCRTCGRTLLRTIRQAVGETAQCRTDAADDLPHRISATG
jgi:hypothetical protein